LYNFQRSITIETAGSYLEWHLCGCHVRVLLDSMFMLYLLGK